MCNKLRTVSVRSEGVSSAGDPGEVKSLCPNIVELDLASSMFHDWQVHPMLLQSDASKEARLAFVCVVGLLLLQPRFLWVLGFGAWFPAQK